MAGGLEALPELTGLSTHACLAVGCVFLLLLFWKPLTALVKLLARTGLGLAFLALLSPMGQVFGFQLGVNLMNALILGLLGVPGFGLLLLLGTVL